MKTTIPEKQPDEAKASAPLTNACHSRRSFVKSVLMTGAAANLVNIGSAGQKNDLDPGAALANLKLLSEAEMRRVRAYQIRVDAALREYLRPIPPHPNNGDEKRYSNKIANFSKGFPHNSLGEVDLNAYNIYLHALATGNPADFEKIPLGCPEMAPYLLVNPQAGLAFDLEGIDSHATCTPPPPAFSSREMTAEIIELYWMALTRDISYLEWDNDPYIQAAAADLSRFGDAFSGPKDPVTGKVTPRTLFRDALPGALIGPYRSQFSYLPAPYDGNFIDQRVLRADPVDFMTTYTEWLKIENGCLPTASIKYDKDPLYIRTGRDMAVSVHNDIVFQDAFTAMLVLVFPFAHPSESGVVAAPLNPGNPYLHSNNQVGFVTFGSTHIASILPEAVDRALKATWFHKWFVHRRLRPEEYGGRIQKTLTGVAKYPIDLADLLASPLFTSTPTNGLVYSKYGSYFLPQAFPEGCPLHPSYPQGHGTAAGACITLLKAFFDEDFVIPNPVVPSDDGTKLVPYTGPDAGQMTVGGELNKLASNIYQSRNFAGVHYRSDGYQALLLGEAVAISILEDQAKTYNEKFPGFTFTKFDGTQITVGGNCK